MQTLLAEAPATLDGAEQAAKNIADTKVNPGDDTSSGGGASADGAKSGFESEIEARVDDDEQAMPFSLTGPSCARQGFECEASPAAADGAVVATTTDVLMDG